MSQSPHHHLQPADASRLCSHPNRGQRDRSKIRWIQGSIDPQRRKQKTNQLDGSKSRYIQVPTDQKVAILGSSNLGSIESWIHRTLDPSNLGSIHFWIHRISYLTLDQSNLGSIGMPPFHEEDETLYALYGWCVLRDITSTFSSSFFSLAVDCE